MKYSIYSASFLLLFPLLTFAQTKSHPVSAGLAHPGGSVLTGRVTDGKQPIPSATITILRKDSTVAARTISKPDGSFIVSNLPEDPYILSISVVGYQPFSRNIPAGPHPGAPFNAGAIRREGLKNGMITLRQDGWRKVWKGITTLDEVARVTAGDIVM